jgi:DNA-directed RNA polymerase subunit K/omega
MFNLIIFYFLFLKKIEIKYLKVSIDIIIIMSDDEYYSDSDVSETNSEEGDVINVPSNKAPIADTNYEDDSEVENIEDSDEEEAADINEENDDDDDLEESDDEEEDDDLEEDKDENDDELAPVVSKKTEKKTEKKNNKKQLLVIDEDEDEEEYDEEYNDNYLEKFDSGLVKNYIEEFHPECLSHNYDEITKLSNIVRNSDGIIIDPLHRTIPYLTKYEKARILGQRAKQIETGSRPFIKIPENIVDGHIIAELELKEKKIPFIIKRPIPGGGCEYWNLKDLEIIAF